MEAVAAMSQIKLAFDRMDLLNPPKVARVQNGAAKDFWRAGMIISGSLEYPAGNRLKTLDPGGMPFNFGEYCFKFMNSAMSRNL
jgi:hypothetical protein